MIDMIKSKKKVILLLLFVAVVLIVLIVSIFDGSDSTSDTDSDVSSNKVNTEVIDINDSAMNSAIDKLLSGDETTGDPCIDTESYIYVNLMCDSYEIVDRYYGDHALFVKVKTTTNDINDYVMVRFQLNDENKISDCITYNIAA